MKQWDYICSNCLYSTLRCTKYAVKNKWMKKGKKTCGEEWWIDLEHRGYSGQQNSLHVIIMTDTFVQTPRMYNEGEVQCTLCECLVIMTCPWRLSDCNRYAILVQWFLDAPGILWTVFLLDDLGALLREI